MLNCFLWYSIIWSLVLVLYSFDITMFNDKLESNLLVFIIFSIIISLILGIIFKDNFKIKYDHLNYNESIRKLKKIRFYMIMLVIGYAIEFLYSKQIPFVSILLGKTMYGEVNVIPVFYVILIAYSIYLGQIISYNYICSENKSLKRKFLHYYLLIILMYILCAYRSMIFINIFISLILVINSKFKKFGIKSFIKIISLVLIGTYLFGIFGNIRQGYNWNDNSYIERLGLYHNYPSIVPKQYMWSYSYITSPLANLNYNIKESSPVNNKLLLIGEFMPKTISKLIIKEDNDENPIYYIRHYFNAVTGYANSYYAYGYIGIYFVYIIMNIITIITIMLSKNSSFEKKSALFCSLILVYSLMFFYNTLNVVSISWPLWINIFSNIKIKKK